jgi:hypothetical protein
MKRNPHSSSSLCSSHNSFMAWILPSIQPQVLRILDWCHVHPWPLLRQLKANTQLAVVSKFFDPYQSNSWTFVQRNASTCARSLLYMLPMVATHLPSTLWNQPPPPAACSLSSRIITINVTIEQNWFHLAQHSLTAFGLCSLPCLQWCSHPRTRKFRRNVVDLLHLEHKSLWIFWL